MNEWKTIESAPKDGSDVIVYASITKEKFVAFWNGIGYQFAMSALGAFIIKDPTHWMPCPDDPKEPA